MATLLSAWRRWNSLLLHNIILVSRSSSSTTNSRVWCNNGKVRFIYLLLLFPLFLSHTGIHSYCFQTNRFVLREPLFPYSDDQPRLCPPSEGYGCACHPMSFGRRAPSQDERVLGTWRFEAGTNGMFGGQEWACVPYGMLFCFSSLAFFCFLLLHRFDSSHLCVGACWKSSPRTADASFFDA